LKQLSAEPTNDVIGIVRNKATTDEKIKTELGTRVNVHIFEADLIDYDALKVRHGQWLLRILLTA
jgi:hypothetical protein